MAHNDFRLAADRVWELAKEYEAKGNKELGIALKDIAMELHDLARKQEQSNNSHS